MLAFFVRTTNIHNRALSKILLKHDFNLIVNLDNNHLCPPIPNRLNYLCWLSDFVSNNTRNIHVLDIGVGATCIYPLLGVRMFNWIFTGSEIDHESTLLARENVSLNNLAEMIRIVEVPNSWSAQRHFKVNQTRNSADGICADGDENSSDASDGEVEYATISKDFILSSSLSALSSPS